MLPDIQPQTGTLTGQAFPRTVEDLNYILPDKQIALYPAARRSDSRLLIWDPTGTPRLHNDSFGEIAAHFGVGDILVLNRTRVLPVRTVARTPSGREVDILWLHEKKQGSWLCFGQTRRIKTGSTLHFAGWQATVEKIDHEYLQLAVSCAVTPLLEQYGTLALPPYIVNRRTQPVWKDDSERYQTVYGDIPGAVAAPTAGLHWSQESIAAVEKAGATVCYVTLHVGPGTFKPLRCNELADHRVDPEWVEVDAATASILRQAHASGARITACGTTTVRALEGAFRKTALQGAFSGWIDETIIPPYLFAMTDRLITNFHLPKSSLLALVAAFTGGDNWRSIYAHAVHNDFRFYSYGDASLLTRGTPIRPDSLSPQNDR